MAWQGWKPAPLPSSFMLAAILGTLISLYWVFPKNPTWGVTFTIIFVCMFIASIVSMVSAPADILIRIDKRDHRKRK